MLNLELNINMNVHFSIQIVWARPPEYFELFIDTEATLRGSEKNDELSLAG